MFGIYFKLGFHHLTELGAWDHQLFLATIALGLAPALWRKWIVFASIFAIGHAIATAGLVLEWFPRNMSWVEPAIALSIVFLALYDYWQLTKDPYALNASSFRVFGGAILLFGVVHGLGIGGAFLSTLGRNPDTATLLESLLGFAVGVEVAQLLILTVFWIIAWLIFDLWQWNPIPLRKVALVGVVLAGLYKFVGFF